MGVKSETLAAAVVDGLSDLLAQIDAIREAVSEGIADVAEFEASDDSE